MIWLWNLASFFAKGFYYNLGADLGEELRGPAPLSMTISEIFYEKNAAKTLFGVEMRFLFSKLPFLGPPFQSFWMRRCQ